jgi:hypothetical protein
VGEENQDNNNTQQLEASTKQNNNEERPLKYEFRFVSYRRGAYKRMGLCQKTSRRTPRKNIKQSKRIKILKIKYFPFI